MAKKYSKFVNFLWKEHLYEELREEAIRQDMNLSQLMRKILSDYLTDCQAGPGGEKVK